MHDGAAHRRVFAELPPLEKGLADALPGKVNASGHQDKTIQNHRPIGSGMIFASDGDNFLLPKWTCPAIFLLNCNDAVFF